MAIKFNCPHCKKVLSVKDESLAGKKAACTGCKKIVVIPKPVPTVGAEDLEALAAAALAEPKAEAGGPVQTVDFECPQCGEAVKVSYELAGKNAPCPECKRIVKVPVPKLKDAADWRGKDDHRPAGARRDTEPAPEGAWEPSRAKLVSGQALLEAGVVKKKKKPGMTRQQKITRGIAAAVALVAISIGGLIGYSSWSQGKQDKRVADIVKAVEESGTARELAAEANRAAGEFYSRTGKRDDAEHARQAFSKARNFLESNPSPQHDLLLADLLLVQVDLAGSDEEAKAALRVKWDDVVNNELRPTLRFVSSAGGRIHALRVLTRKLAARGHSEDAVKLARQPRAPGGPAAGTQANEAQEALAVVGAELFRAGQKELAGTLARQAAASYPGAKPDTQPPLGPWVVAVCVATDKPEPKPGKAKEDADILNVGRAVGLALKGDTGAARAQQFKEPEAHFMALVLMASISHDPAEVDAAAALFDGDLKGHVVSAWLLHELVEVAARAGPAERVPGLLDRIVDPGLKAAAQLEIVRARLEAAKGHAGDNVLEGLGPDPLSQALAREALARQNARFDSNTLKEVEGWNEAVRPFGILGAILGEQDRKQVSRDAKRSARGETFIYCSLKSGLPAPRRCSRDRAGFTGGQVVTPKEVLALIREKEVRAVDLRFMDFPGLWQHFSIPAEALDEGVFEEGLGFDGSSIRGWQAINESDMLVLPQPETAFIDPFCKDKTLTLICNIQDPLTKEDYTRDPRNVARKAVNYMKSTGIADTAYFGPELEFFVFDDVRYDQTYNCGYYYLDSAEGAWNTGRVEGPNLGYKLRYKEGYFPVPPSDALHDIRSEMMLTMIECGLKIEAQHHEVATGGQGEIDMKYAPLVEMADNVLKYKYIIKMVARKHGKTATFMPKPLFMDNGSGMHVHSSLWKDGKNLYAGSGYAGLSDMAMYAIGGLLRHAPALCAITNPTTNSYKRLVPGYEAPVNLAYSRRNRSASIRIPVYSPSPKAKRIEFRCPDGSSNPYLAFSAMLMAMLDGIKNKLKPGEPLDKDIYDLDPEELAKVPKTPGSLDQALDNLEKDHEFLLQGDVFTSDVISTWIWYKREKEVDAIRLRPHPYEFALYFDI